VDLNYTALQLRRLYSYNIIISSLVQYGCKTLFLNLVGEQILGVLEYRLRKTEFGPKRNDVMGDWRKLQSGLYNLHCSPNIIRVIESRRAARHAAYLSDRNSNYYLKRRDIWEIHGQIGG
jgi:hypothetical protein